MFRIALLFSLLAITDALISSPEEEDNSKKLAEDLCAEFKKAFRLTENCLATERCEWWVGNSNTFCCTCAQKAYDLAEDNLRVQIDNLAAASEKGKSTTPLHMWVVAGVATGKSTFVETIMEKHIQKHVPKVNAKKFMAQHLVVNADEIRGVLVGGYEKYAEVSQWAFNSKSEWVAGVLRKMMVPLRNYAFEYSHKQKVHVISDTVSGCACCDGSDKLAIDSGIYTTHLLFLQVGPNPGTDTDHYEESIKRIKARAANGGHAGADAMNMLSTEAFAEIREKVNKCAGKHPNQVFFYQSQDHIFTEMPLACAEQPGGVEAGACPRKMTRAEIAEKKHVTRMMH